MQSTSPRPTIGRPTTQDEQLYLLTQQPKLETAFVASEDFQPGLPIFNLPTDWAISSMGITARPGEIVRIEMKLVTFDQDSRTERDVIGFLHPAVGIYNGRVHRYGYNVAWDKLEMDCKSITRPML